MDRGLVFDREPGSPVPEVVENDEEKDGNKRQKVKKGGAVKKCLWKLIVPAETDENKGEIAKITKNLRDFNFTLESYRRCCIKKKDKT